MVRYYQKHVDGSVTTHEIEMPTGTYTTESVAAAIQANQLGKVVMTDMKTMNNESRNDLMEKAAGNHTIEQFLMDSTYRVVTKHNPNKKKGVHNMSMKKMKQRLRRHEN